MTPKRYLAFGALTIAIQTGVIASQPSAAMLQNSPLLSAAKSSVDTNQNRVTLSFIAPNKSVSAAANTSATPIQQSKSSTKNINNAAKTRLRSKPIDKSIVAAADKAKVAKQIEQNVATPSASILNKALAVQDVATDLVDKNTNTEPTESTTSTAKLDTTSAKTNIVELTKPLFATQPPKPEYPRIARRKGLEGTATVEVMFNELGEQLALTLVKSSGFSLLDQAALQAVETWQFEAPAPKLANHYKVTVPIRFALN
ncbi:energy transducer TonB [Shewanella glacialipiscicola]|uniref:energy transducer TonB n=1 Tax=Shewanella glacialipiscicola TaxID=614069 RepID=UPI0021DAAA51|nr:energy transducer TonB [Shewanella glacialipiscicola]MCU7995381.1 energy transducer TonB [Shewanella glacialipiscicola]MCU8025589.1 energy transducer TonB [Shewanella glacialipiscicola]